MTFKWQSDRALAGLKMTYLYWTCEDGWRGPDYLLRTNRGMPLVLVYRTTTDRWTVSAPPLLGSYWESGMFTGLSLNAAVLKAERTVLQYTSMRPAIGDLACNRSALPYLDNLVGCLPHRSVTL